MIIALLFFALASAFSAAAATMVAGFSFWIALAVYPFAGTTALLLGAATVALVKTNFSTSHDHCEPAHA